MKSRLTGRLTTMLAFGVGLTTMLGLMADQQPGQYNSLPGALPPGIQTLTATLLDVFSVTVALTILAGILNLVLVHLRRARRRAPGRGYSLVLAFSALAVIALTMTERLAPPDYEPLLSGILLEQVQVTVESSLAGLLLFALVYGAWRVLRVRASAWGLLFLLTMLVALAGALPLAELAFLANIHSWLLALPVSAGARGILLGIALATVVTGVRALIGQERILRRRDDD